MKRKGSTEDTLIGQLMEALFHARTLEEVVRTTEATLLRLTSADCLAVCASRIGQPGQNDWLVARMPEVYFERYAEWKDRDFVRAANERHPNQVLRDGDFISHQDLEASTVYRIGVDMGVPLEQVMSVYLTQAGWEGNGGFSAYRLKRRPFSDNERRIVQRIAPLLATAIQKCQMFVECDLMNRLLEVQLEEQNTASLVLTTEGEVVKSVGPMPRLLAKWFPGDDREVSGLPASLVRTLRPVMKQARLLEPEPRDWDMPGEGETLKVTFRRLQAVGEQHYWRLNFREVTHPQLLTWLKELTPKEVEIAHLLFKGLSDKDIAQQLRNRQGKANSPGTIKKHLSHIYEKLKPFGVHNRADFMARAHQPGRQK